MKTNETIKHIINMFIMLLLVVSLTALNFQTYRLGQAQRELERTRIELNRASDQQQRIGEIVRGTNSILRESFSTVSGLREQIAVIRESYEEMEKLLYSIGTDNSGLSNMDNREALDNEEVGRSN